MFKKSFFFFFMFLFQTRYCFSQQGFGNEWIDYNKTYYKFNIRSTQLCRISKTVLAKAGLADTPAEYFQLWLNGNEVPVFTTSDTGVLAANGYIEFIGLQNDGKMEADLYPHPSYQPFNKRSLFTDTSWYFLTINKGKNARLTQTLNDVAAAAIPVDSFINESFEVFTPTFLSGGYAESVPYGAIDAAGNVATEPFRSSAFDKGEGFAYAKSFDKNDSIKITLSNLRLYVGAEAVKIKYATSGNANFIRNVQLFMNGVQISTKKLAGYEFAVDSIVNIPSTNIVNDAASFTVTTDNDNWDDDNYLHFINISYKRKWHLNKVQFYEFNLPANLQGNHLRIAAFNTTGSNPILYDFTNLKRYIGVQKVDSVLFLLQPSLQNRALALASAFTSRIWQVDTFTSVVFTDYSKRENQSDFIIISNPVLYNFNGHNYVEEYRTYRSSAQGGAYNAKLYDINNLADQFAYGQRKNPLSIKNFIRYLVSQAGNNTSAILPKFVFLIGRGCVYTSYRNYKIKENEYFNAVPTFGIPASDNFLTSADNLNATPLVPIGRLSVLGGGEIANYLDKVKQYDSLNFLANADAESTAWKKEVIQSVSFDDSYNSSIVAKYMNYYASILMDTLIGASVKTYVKFAFDTLTDAGGNVMYREKPNPNFATEAAQMHNRINNGVGLINYFGHSAGYNFNNPEGYSMKRGRYPVFYENGCKTGNVFEMDFSRSFFYGFSLPERYLLYPNGGGIAFIAGTDLGTINYLNILSSFWCKAAANTCYGKSIGEINQTAIKNTINALGIREFKNRRNCEQLTLHGDPSLVLYPNYKPDFYTQDSLISISAFTSVALDSVDAKIKFHNIGKGTRDSVWLEVKRQFPDGSVQPIIKKIIRPLAQKSHAGSPDSLRLFLADSLTLRIGINGIFDKGTNYIIASLDPTNEQDEMSEANNEGKRSFEVSDEEIVPTSPYKYAIVNNPEIILKASTANAVQQLRTYRIEIDTTAFFNSSLLLRKDTATLGGTVSWQPVNNWQNGSVYYWRTAPLINGQPVNWQNSSFQYMQGMYSGFGQSHFYQHLQSTFSQINLDSSNRQFAFGKNLQNLFLSTAVFGYGAFTESDNSVLVNGIRKIVGACRGQSIIFQVFDTLNFEPWSNPDGRFNSTAVCSPSRLYNFEFGYNNPIERKKAMDFLDSIPPGMIVVSRLVLDPSAYTAGKAVFDSAFANTWKADTLIYGSQKSLYHYLYKQGFTNLDSLYYPRTFVFLFKKDDTTTLKPSQVFSYGLYDKINVNIFLITSDTMGAITSPIFGPAAAWKELHWSGENTADEFSHIDNTFLQLIGIDTAAHQTVLHTYKPTEWKNDISEIDAKQYPFLRLILHTKNANKATPFQLKYWRLFYTPAADGALSALDYSAESNPILVNNKDSFSIKLAFKNISNMRLDSTNATLKMIDRNGSETVYQLPKVKPLDAGDTAIICFSKKIIEMDGTYRAVLSVNENKNPYEQHWFNNFARYIFEVGVPLPDMNVNFYANTNKNSVILNWDAAFEKEIATYTIEHGTLTTHYTNLKSIMAENKNNIKTKYFWTHLNPSQGKNYYRLRVNLLSGNFYYTPIQEVFFDSSISISVSPNPFVNYLKINITPSNQSKKITIYTYNGQPIISKRCTGSCILHTQNLVNGIYIISIGEIQEKAIKLEKRQ